MTDKNNKVNRVWNDPPMPGENPVNALPQNVTLGAGVSDDVKRAFALLDTIHRVVRLLSMITLSASFTIAYYILSNLSWVDSSDILLFFVLATVTLAIFEVMIFTKRL